MLTVIENAYYLRKAQKVLTEEQRFELIDYISVNYRKGDILANTGGVRKIRFAHQSGKGKRGACRIIYLVIDDHGCIHLLDIFEKNVQSNLSYFERKEIKKLVETLKKRN